MKDHKQTSQKDIQPNEPLPPVLIKAIRLADAGRLQEAIELLSPSEYSSNPAILNARGVCLMRAGSFDLAIRVFRSLLLPAGCTWMRPEMPVIYRTNFSTALLLGDLPLGVRDTLCEIVEQEHPSVVRLRETLRRWERSLTFWQRLNWKLGIAPDVPITIDFVPGEFIEPPSSPPNSPASGAATASSAVQQAA